jgi:arabinofuranan 3-O-arabinosyltransferase
MAAASDKLRWIRVIGLTLALAYLVILGGTFLQGEFLVDATGRPIANDFVVTYAAGRLTLSGTAIAAYAPTIKQAEVAAVGHDFENFYGWHYPPYFLFVAASLATLPYLVAAISWLLATLAAYATGLANILGRTGIYVALGFPATLWNITAGQNGFFTAALIGGTLGFLERRPVCAGICLGLLTYKPQFGVLFPFALIAGRHWLTIIVASAVTLGLVTLSWFAFGSASWIAFVQGMPAMSRAVLSEGRGDFNRLQSVFGLVRAHGGGEELAWTIQVTLSAALGAGMIWLWRSRVSFDLKAAALATGAVLATPYLYMYDVVVLGVAAAFLIRFAAERKIFTAELLGFAAACVLILIFPYVTTQLGLAAALILMALAVRRVFAERNAIPPGRRPEQA